MTRGAAVALLILLTAAAGCGDRNAPHGDYARWRPLLAAELSRAAIDRPDDLYKFLHQGVMGPAHAAPDVAHARNWLDGEWAETRGLTAAGRPPLLQPLRPDGRLVRVDLVRLRELAGDDPAVLQTLAQAFVTTGQTWSRRPQELGVLWAAAEADTALWRDHFAAIDLEHLDRERAGAWPAVHHSDSYRMRLAPHYRVVDPTHLPAAWRQAEVSP